MKTARTYLIIVLLFYILGAVKAQNSTWFETGTSWTYNFDIQGPIFSENRTATFEITELTVLNGQECAKMELLDEVWNPCTTVAPPYYFYESNDSIYYSSDYDPTFRLAYDFGAVVGDSWNFVVPVEMFETLDTFLVSVLSVSTTTLSGEDLKVMELGYENISQTMHSTMQYLEYTVTEKLGSEDHFFIPLGESGGEILACEGAIYIELQCFSSPSLVYMNPDFQSCTVDAQNINFEEQVRIYPNPSFGETIQIELPQNSQGALSLIDITGRKVLSQNVHEQFISLSVSSVSPGMYTLWFEGNQGHSFSRKIIVN